MSVVFYVTGSYVRRSITGRSTFDFLSAGNHSEDVHSLGDSWDRDTCPRAPQVVWSRSLKLWWTVFVPELCEFFVVTPCPLTDGVEEQILHLDKLFSSGF